MLQKTLSLLVALSAIPGFTHGFEQVAIRSICGGSDSSVPAKCYINGSALATTLPLAYERSLPVARLALPDTYYCTGFLVGSEGHFLTAGSCITGEADATVAGFEFGAESTSCADECKVQLGCKGTILRTTSELVVSSLTPDYALVKLAPGADLDKYGYLQVRGEGAVVGESVYVPGHPNVYPKRIAAYTQGTTPASIVGLGVMDICDTISIAYDADTQGGSAGSPLIAWSDNLVLGIHACGGCTSTGGTNGATDIRDILADMAAKNIVIKDFVYASPSPETTTPPPVTTTPAPTTTSPPPITTTPPPVTTTPPPVTTTPPQTTTTPPPATTTPPPTTTTPPSTPHPTTTAPPPTTTGPPKTTTPPTRAPGYCP